MTQEKLDSIIALKEKIDQLERTLSDDEYFYIGNRSQGTSDYFIVRKGSCLYEGICSLLNKELECSKKQFETT